VVRVCVVGGRNVGALGGSNQVGPRIARLTRAVKRSLVPADAKRVPGQAMDQPRGPRCRTVMARVPHDSMMTIARSTSDSHSRAACASA